MTLERGLSLVTSSRKQLGTPALAQLPGLCPLSAIGRPSAPGLPLSEGPTLSLPGWCSLWHEQPPAPRDPDAWPPGYRGARGPQGHSREGAQHGGSSASSEWPCVHGRGPVWPSSRVPGPPLWGLWVGWEQCARALPSSFMGLGSRCGFASRAAPALHSDSGGGLLGPGGWPAPPRCTLCSLGGRGPWGQGGQQLLTTQQSWGWKCVLSFHRLPVQCQTSVGPHQDLFRRERGRSCGPHLALTLHLGTWACDQPRPSGIGGLSAADVAFRKW